MDIGSSPLLTDLYQLNMMQAYLDHGETQAGGLRVVRAQASARARLPGRCRPRAGAAFLENLRFSADELDWLAAHRAFPRHLIDYLAALRFTGDVHAMPEGTVFFADEPILRVTAPLPQAQFVETRLINLLHFQTLIASKAARMVLAAPRQAAGRFRPAPRARRRGRADGRARRATSPASPARPPCWPSSCSASRSSAPWRIPSSQAHDDEATAFEHFARARPDSPDAADRHVRHRGGGAEGGRAGAALAGDGITIRGVRLDSGDLVGLARSVRAILDDGGLRGSTIFASGGLDEYASPRWSRPGRRSTASASAPA